MAHQKVDKQGWDNSYKTEGKYANLFYTKYKKFDFELNTRNAFTVAV